MREFRETNNDSTFTWARQTRFDTQLFDTGEPLGEENEVYLCQVLAVAGPIVLREFNPTTPTQVYTAAQKTADGTDVLNFRWRVRQRSSKMHQGRQNTITITA